MKRFSRGARTGMGVLLAVFVAGSLALHGQGSSGEAAGARHLVAAGAGDELQRAVAAAMPGDTVVLGNGIWRDQQLILEGRGRRDQPVVIRAETQGSVHFTGGSSIVLRGSDLTLIGLSFKDGHLDAEGQIILLDGRRLQLMNTVIDGYNPPSRDQGYTWVTMRGQNQLVERCTFRGKSHLGPILEVMTSQMQSDHHYIRGNHFLDRPSGSGRGWETLRLERRSLPHASSYTVVEENLFEGCNGGAELISSRSSGNTFRRNTFRRNEGALSLRHGQASLVEANYFFGEHVAKAGAIRVAGRGHVVINNYVEAAGSWGVGAIALDAGVPDGPTGSHEAADGAVVAFNTIIDAPGPFLHLANGLGNRGRTRAPADVAIANNVFFASKYPEGDFLQGEAGSGLKLEGNVFYGRAKVGGPVEEEVEMKDPLLAPSEGGLLRPERNSPVVSSAVGTYRMVALDIDSQRRGSMKDVGCDEVSDTPVKNRPLTSADVGAVWFIGSLTSVEP